MLPICGSAKKGTSVGRLTGPGLAWTFFIAR
jgi:hypothetical protein